MATEITKQKAGYEDIQFGLTTEIQNRQEGTTIVPKEITQINASHIPYDEFQSVEQAISAVGGGTSSSTTIIYGAGEPAATINPLNGTNAIYVNTENNFNYLCSDATTDANVWIKSTSGQFLGQSKVGAVMFSSQTTDENLVLPDGQNGLIVDSLEVTGDGSIEVQGNAVLVTV
jgi:hypothetical protein